MLKRLAMVCGALLVLAGGFIAFLYRTSTQRVEAPTPPLKANPSPSAVARGEVIFRGSCEGCHRETTSSVASGRVMTEVPAALGTFVPSNLTSHPTAGIGLLSDGSVARTIRYGVTRDGRQTLMPAFAMGDSDVAALLGFLRSNHPLFSPDPTVRPPTQLSFLGRLVFAATLKGKAPATAASGVPVPPRANTIEYGHYLAHAVFQCAHCHTEGHAPDRAEGPEALSGGGDFQDDSGQRVLSPNLTPDKGTGLGHWSLAHFQTALREGLKPNGLPIRSPMPRYRALEDLEISALFTYLSSVPPVRSDTPASSPQAAAEKSLEPEKRYAQLGCPSCHAPGLRYYASLVAAARKETPEHLAEWIRDPARFKPGTVMPSFGSRLTAEEALSLSRWIKSQHALPPVP